MFGEFPHYFHPDNLENLFVFVDQGRVVSHFGMTRRWASLEGSTVGVASVGAVATYEEYRGKGLATQLFEHSRREMIAHGIDFMLISGGRGLYRRAGAADFGTNYTGVLDPGSISLPAERGITISEFEHADFDACRLAYSQKAVHYVRTRDDWEGFLNCRYAMCLLCNMIVLRQDGVFAGYMVFSKTSPDGSSRMVELAGDERALFLALQAIVDRYQIKKLRVNLQPENHVIKALLESVGLSLEPQPNVGTLLVLNMKQLMERLRPYFETRVGIQCAKAIVVKELDGDVFVFTDGQDELRVQGLQNLGDFVFGVSRERVAGSVWSKVFPVPGLWYGLNYI